MTSSNRQDTPTAIPAVTSVSASEWTGLVIAVFVAAVIGLIVPSEPDRVTITIDNPTDYRLYINAHTPEDDSSTFVTIINPHATHTARGVVDLGPTWILELRTLGSAAGNLTVSHRDLTKATYTIPAEIDRQLKARRIPTNTPAP